MEEQEHASGGSNFRQQTSGQQCPHRVHLWPQKSADIIDLAMKGKVAVVEAIERDFDDRLHLAVVLEDDPGRDLGLLRQPGHCFFFSPEEVVPLKREVCDGR